jgi:hypothetical protein
MNSTSGYRLDMGPNWLSEGRDFLPRSSGRPWPRLRGLWSRASWINSTLHNRLRCLREIPMTEYMQPTFSSKEHIHAPKIILPLQAKSQCLCHFIAITLDFPNRITYNFPSLTPFYVVLIFRFLWLLE